MSDLKELADTAIHWLKASLNCDAHVWDQDQREMAEHDVEAYRAGAQAHHEAAILAAIEPNQTAQVRNDALQEAADAMHPMLRSLVSRAAAYNVILALKTKETDNE